MKQVVIAGAGFAGLRLARELSGSKDIAVTLINSSADFRYSPALYRAATGFKLGTARIPLEWALIDTNNTALVVGVVNDIDREKKVIILDDGKEIHYDYAIFALGAVTTYFGIAGLQNHSYGIKTPEEVMQLKQHIHEKLTDKEARQQNYVIVGGGATGVELSGAIGAYLKRISKKHSVRKPHVSVYLVEAGPRILPQMSEKASREVSKHLQKLGIQILCDTVVNSETSHSLKTSQGTIETHNVIWTAGTANNPFFKEHPDTFSLDKRGRVIVNEHLQVNSSIYVCGDNASTPHSGLALSAVWHASFVARDIRARMHTGHRPKVFEKNPIQVVPAGEKWSVMQYKGLVLHGRLISYMRRIADFVGYAEVLGPMKALTIWSNGERTEETCERCRR